MRKLSRRLCLLQMQANKGPENSKYIALLTSESLVVRSCSNIVIHTPNNRPFTKSHFTWQQEENGDSLIEARPTIDKNSIDSGALTINGKYREEESFI
jgi:hypothetical protein